MSVKSRAGARENLKALVEERNRGFVLEAAVSAILPEEKDGLTAGEIAERLVELSFPIHEYTNFEASVHFALRRLVSDEKVGIWIRLRWCTSCGEPSAAFRYVRVSSDEGAALVLKLRVGRRLEPYFSARPRYSNFRDG